MDNIYFNKLTLIFSCLIYNVRLSIVSDDDLGSNKKITLQYENQVQGESECWIKLNAKEHFNNMDALDARQHELRSIIQDYAGEQFDKPLVNDLVNSRGVLSGSNPNLIPSGINLGGYFMMRMQNSLLFFYRLKLRNDTIFRVNYIRSDFVDMTLTGRLSLHDLHLVGAYDRALTDRNFGVMYYSPTYGQVEFLLKNVQYNMEARMRLVTERVNIELIISEIYVEDILMTYENSTEKPIRLQKANLNQFLDRLKIDLNKWLLDYFHDYLSHKKFMESKTVPFQRAEKEKAVVLNEYADSAIQILKRRICKVGACSVKLPQFTIYANEFTQIKLKDGVIRGLDTMYRRSVATGAKHDKLRKVDLVVAFSSLKVMYTYQAILSPNVSTLTGLLVLTADELNAQLGITLVKEPEAFDLNFNFIEQLKPEALTVEGPANRMIANFKHILEHHILAIMSNALLHNIKMLNTLSRCVPQFYGHVDIHNDTMNDEPAVGHKGLKHVIKKRVLPKYRPKRAIDKMSLKKWNGNDDPIFTEYENATFVAQLADDTGYAHDDDK